jgi:hypothetical protein
MRDGQTDSNCCNQAITRFDILGGLRVRLSFRVAVITFVLIVVFTFFPVALVFIILALVAGERRLRRGQEGLSRGIVEVFCARPIVRLRA